MCLNPGTLPDGTQVLCRECWQCRYDRVNDWVGRCIAESRTAVATNAITLTYGREDAEGNPMSWDEVVDRRYSGVVNHPRAAVLTYSDVQKWLKYLRVEGYPLRYFVAGEYGSRKGRAHWHVIAFWQKKVPPHELNVDFAERHWKRGWSHWTEPVFEKFRYNMKYILKNYDNEFTQSHQGQSRLPPLGSAYFAQQAVECARQGLPPDAHYSFPEAVRESGERYRFRLADRSLELFYEAWRDAWDRFHPDRPYPSCKLTDKFENLPWDGVGGGLIVLRDDAGEFVGFEGNTEFIRDPYKRAPMPAEGNIAELSRLCGDEVPWNPLVPDMSLGFDGKRNALFYKDSRGRVWHWLEHEGVMTWLDVAERVAARRRKIEWDLAVKAAAQTPEPWRIKPGSKPRPRSRIGTQKSSSGRRRH